MKNPRFWRVRSVEDVRKRLENLKASIVYERIVSRLPIEPSPRKRVRRLARKVRRMERTEKLE